MSDFVKLGLSEPLLKAVQEMGFEEATPIQLVAIPLAMAGKDVIGQAQTGTGKTAAFGIPLMERIDAANPGVQALIVAPTRELAIQVAEELNQLGRFKAIRSLPIYGGQDISRQIRGLKQRPQIIVGTPGRLMDHMRRKTLRLDHVGMVVLDEADEMLNMGFIEDIQTILAEVPSERQTMLFSATVPVPIQRLARQFMIEPELVKVQSKGITVPEIAQGYLEVPENKKFDVLCNLLDITVPDLAIIFGRTKRRVDELTQALNRRGYSAEGIHGDLTQARRDQVMRLFRDASIDLLVATDVAARGLDIIGVTHIINFDIPHDPESYVHRIGRTGRAGKTGIALTFVTPREEGQLRNIERLIKQKISRQRVPSIHDARQGQQRLAQESLIQTAEQQDVESYRRMAEELLDDQDSVTLVAAALKLLTREPNTTPVSLTMERPPVEKRTQSTHQRSNRSNRSSRPRSPGGRDPRGSSRRRGS